MFYLWENLCLSKLFFDSFEDMQRSIYIEEDMASPTASSSAKAGKTGKTSKFPMFSLWQDLYNKKFPCVSYEEKSSPWIFTHDLHMICLQSIDLNGLDWRDVFLIIRIYKSTYLHKILHKRFLCEQCLKRYSVSAGLNRQDRHENDYIQLCC